MGDSFYKLGGIYSITNKINGKRYIGSSINFMKRWSSHRMDLSRNEHRNSYLQNAWNKYGAVSFSFDIVEEVKDSYKLLEREQYWIDFYQSSNKDKGYNISPTAGNCFGIIHTERESSKQLKEEILNFCRQFGYRPVHNSKNKLENRLGTALHNFISQNEYNHDAVFEEKIKKYPTFKKFRKITLIKNIFNFIDKNGYLPSRISKDKKERKLRLTLDRFISPSTDMYDFSIKKLISNVPTKNSYKANLV